MTQFKAHYASPTTALLILSLSAGLASLLALVLLKPKCTPLSSRLQTLLSLSTFLFLSNILTITLLKVLLYPLRSTDLVSGWRKRLVTVGLGITYLSSLLGFLVIAITAAVKTSSVSKSKDSKVVGITGVALFFVLALSIVVLGLTSPSPPSTTVMWQDSSPVTQHPLTPAPGDEKKQRPLVDDFPLPKSVLVVLIFVIQIISLGVILGFGGAAAVRGEVGKEACAGEVGGGFIKDVVLKVDVVEWHVPGLYEEEPGATQTETHTLTLSEVFAQSVGGNITETGSKSRATTSSVHSSSVSSTTAGQAEATGFVVVTTETTTTVQVTVGS